MTLHSTEIDALWAAFCDTLPTESRDDAPKLVAWLGLAPAAGVPWSKVFKHEVTLAAPSLFADAMPNASPAIVRLAVMAHLLGIVEAFTTDRISDAQALDTRQIQRLLMELRATRDRAVEALNPLVPSAFPDAERRAHAAMTTERLLLQDHTPLSFADYHCLSLAKQAAAFPATLALAEAAGWGERRRRVVARVLEGIVMGLQLYDDVVDWEEDWRGGAAWAACLSRGQSLATWPAEHTSELGAVRTHLRCTGVLASMLNRGSRHFRNAARLAAVLGTKRLAAWSKTQERRLAELALHEHESCGYAVRARHLRAWASEVLA
jgi:hypothetical protein